MGCGAKGWLSTPQGVPLAHDEQLETVDRTTAKNTNPTNTIANPPDDGFDLDAPTPPPTAPKIPA